MKPGYVIHDVAFHEQPFAASHRPEPRPCP